MPGESAVIETPITPSAPAPTDWRPHMTDELKADPVVSKWAEKASEKDISGLIKGYAHTFTKQGNAINLPGKDAKPEEVTALKAKLIEAGVLPKPITDAKEYGIAKPGNLPAGVNWSEELSGKFASTLQKHQIPKEAVADLMALHLESMGNAAGSFAADRDTVIAQLKTEHGEKYDERREMADRLVKDLFKTDAEAELANRLGLGENANFISLLMRIAPLAMQDSSFVEKMQRPGGEITGDAARKEYADIMSDPKNPMFDGFKRGDKDVMRHIDELYKRAYGTEPVVI